MEPKPEIKLVFTNCGTCGNILAQCCCAAARNEFDALSEYILLRTQMGVLELRESECRCSDFYTCDLCRESSGIENHMRRLIDLWGDNWAVRLWSQRESLSTGPAENGLMARLTKSKG
jgi:hypothetical protein